MASGKRGICGRKDLPSLLFTELDGLGDESLVVGELGGGEAGVSILSYCYNVHEGRVGSGVLGLVSTNRLEISGVGNDNGTGAVHQSLLIVRRCRGIRFQSIKRSRHYDICVFVCNVIDKKVKVRGR